MGNESKAGLFSALAQGANAYVAATNPVTRAEAQLAKKRSDSELAKLNQLEQSGTTQQQLEILKMQNDQLLKEGAKRDLFSAFDRFRADGNTRHINKTIHSNPMLKETFPDVISVDKLDPNADKDLMHQNRLPPKTIADPNMLKRFLKVTKPDGTKTIADMVTIYGGTGYTAYQSDIELQRMLIESTIAKNMRSSSDEQGDTALVRNASSVAAAKNRIATGSPDPADSELVRGWDKELAGTTPAKMDMAQGDTDRLVSAFGGEDQFWQTDFSDPKNFRKAYPYITRIEALEDSKLSETVKKELRDIAALNALGEPGAKLSGKETGLLDSLLLNAKKYMSDEVGGVEATSAYSAYRNSIRHALYGSALTPAEIDSFDQAFGTLKQKLGPVLQQFKTALQQVRARLESVSRMENPYTAQVRLGVDQEQLDKVLTALDERIAHFDNYQKGRTIGAKPTSTTPQSDVNERLKQRLRDKAGATK